MKKNILNAPFLTELEKTATNMYRLGWDERNGGNISVLLDEQEVSTYLDVHHALREIPVPLDAKALAGKIFLVTGTGKYFKNVEADPQNNLGIVRISDDGASAQLLWGFEDGGEFTSEMPAHLMTHIARLSVDPHHRVVMHSHPTYTVAMSAVSEVDEKAFTYHLWQSHTEAVIVFPDGVGVLPTMVCGTREIGAATAEKMKEYRLVVWTNHGIYGTGRSMDEAFGLIETVEKTAQLYMLQLGHTKNYISDETIRGLAARYGETPRAGILKDEQ